MDNQHGKTSNMITNKIIWLAGITDGDGCIGLHRQPFNNKVNFVPNYSISTTCKDTHEYLDVLFNELEIGHHWTYRKSNKKEWKDRWVLETRGMLRNERLLFMLVPYLVTKKNEANIVLNFIKSRLSKSKMISYIPEELAMVEELKSIKDSRNGNIVRILRDLTPNTIIGEDKVRSNAKVLANT